MNQFLVGLIFALAERLPISQTSVFSLGLLSLSVFVEYQADIESASFWPIVAVVALLLILLAIFGQIVSYLLKEISDLKNEKEAIREKYEAVITGLNETINKKDAEIASKATMIERLISKS